MSKIAVKESDIFQNAASGDPVFVNPKVKT